MKNVVHMVPAMKSKGWAVVRQGQKDSLAEFQSWIKAIYHAVAVANESGAEIRVHDKYGRPGAFRTVAPKPAM